MASWTKNEKGKPDFSKEELEKRAEKAKSIRESVQKQATERHNKFFVPPARQPKEFLGILSKWRSDFREFRKQQSQFAHWGRLTQSFPAIVFDDKKKKPICYELKNFRALDVPAGGNIEVFDKLWKKYDERGIGSMSYRKFKDLLSDLGFGFGFGPGFSEVDPSRSGKVTFDQAAQWWFKGQSPTHRPRINKKKRDIVHAVQCLHEANKEHGKKFSLLSKEQVKRARNNARIKSSRRRSDLHSFIKKNRGIREKRFKLDISAVDFRQEYDVTDYKPVSYKASPLELAGLNKIWKQYDDKMLGFISSEKVIKLVEEVSGIEGIGEACPFNNEDGDVTFEDFSTWWFEAKYERPARKKKEEEKVEEKEVKRTDFGAKSAEFKKFRAQKLKANKSKSKWDVEFFIGKEKFGDNLESYVPVYAPAGCEGQLNMLDTIWKKADKKGFGRFDREQFTKFLKKQGIAVDKEVADKLSNKDGFITFERFATWWFSNSEARNVEPKASPEKKQRCDAIRSQTRTIAKKFCDRFAPSESQFSDRQKARAKYEEVRKKFRAHRVKSANASPSKKQRDHYNFDFVITYKDPNGLTVVGQAANIIG